MLRVTYLSHSGFAVTVGEGKALLVFDCHRDPSHAIHRILEEYPDIPVTFFVSHRHTDHFTPDIFEIAQNHKRTYVISNDVPAKIIPSTLNVAGMSPGDVVSNLPGDITVKAYASTDEGVCFLVGTKDGKRIFHAGDLNDWHWKDESTEREVAKAEARFRVIVDRIAADVPAMDVAMFPVDTRLGSDYYQGAKIFLDAIKVEDFFPMHFNGSHEKACDFASYAPSYTSCHCLWEPGESIEISQAVAAEK